MELPTAKRFKFLFLGGLIHRKGLDILLKAYASAFTADDDAVLVVKAQGGGVYSDGGLHGALEELRRRPGAPEILLLQDSLDEPALASLYRACDAFVAPYRGEGFGLPILEAMACGLPPIVTRAGASADFVDEASAWRLPSARIPVPRIDDLLPGPAGFWLEEPDEGALARALREAYEHPETCRSKGEAAREHALTFTWERGVEKAKERLWILAGRQPRRFRPPPRVALLHQPDWKAAEWVEVLLAYAGAFQAGEPVLLLLCQEPDAALPVEEAQELVVRMLAQAGFTAFPDICVPEDAQDLVAQLRTCDAFHWVGPRTDGAEAPAGGALGRFHSARARLVG